MEQNSHHGAGVLREIAAGLAQSPAHIACKYLYDALGSQLFEHITRLPEYYPTRTERSIMALHGAEIARRAGPVDSVIELGAGNCEKARALCEQVKPARYVALDISADFLQDSAAGLRAAMPWLDVQTVVGDLTCGVELPAVPGPRLVFYPGSSIGNFAPRQAHDLLLRMRAMAGDDGSLLIGVDLRKEAAVLEAAYDDEAGVTAAFNLNMLAHVNRLIGSDFDLGQWEHRAFFNEALSRIEMHLQAREDTAVRWPGGERRFARGDTIHTENSYKYGIEEFALLLMQAGFRRTATWTDDKRWFAVVLARP